MKIEKWYDYSYVFVCIAVDDDGILKLFVKEAKQMFAAYRRGLKHGIPKDLGLKLAAKAVEGAAKMVMETGIHPAKLKDAVCSPGGTTIAAVLELEKGGFTTSVSSAVDACVKRAEEMSAK